MKNTIKIGCEILIVENDKILLGKRKNCYGAGNWALPGGHLEYGESLKEAAKRELQEELGIVATNLDFFSIVDDIRLKEHYIHVSFILNEYSGSLSLKEPEKCEEWRFFKRNNLPLNIFNPHKKIIENWLKPSPNYRLDNSLHFFSN